jgi:hypothetical protein
MKAIRPSLIITILILFLIIGYLYVSESFITEEEKAKYPNFVSETPANVFFLNPPKEVDQKTGLKKGRQIKYACDVDGKDCKFDLLF